MSTKNFRNAVRAAVVWGFAGVMPAAAENTPLDSLFTPPDAPTDAQLAASLGPDTVADPLVDAQTLAKEIFAIDAKSYDDLLGMQRLLRDIDSDLKDAHADYGQLLKGKSAKETLYLLAGKVAESLDRPITFPLVIKPGGKEI